MGKHSKSETTVSLRIDGTNYIHHERYLQLMKNFNPTQVKGIALTDVERHKLVGQLESAMSEVKNASARMIDL